MTDATHSHYPEPDDLGDDDPVPVELVELHQVLAWEKAVAEAEGGDG